MAIEKLEIPKSVERKWDEEDFTNNLECKIYGYYLNEGNHGRFDIDDSITWFSCYAVKRDAQF